MMTSLKSSLYFFIISFSTSILSAGANIAEYDEYWTRRAEEAKNNNMKAYHPNPHSVIRHFNLNVHKSYEEMENNTRRSLTEGGGGGEEKEECNRNTCSAVNPIDKCWRCDPKWADNRKKLADCVLGFGRDTRGGKSGEYYVVTDPSDNDLTNPKNGTLRHAATRNVSLWIYFANSMKITLNQELLVTSDKTIDGRGAKVEITGGKGIMMQFVKNVIIHGLHIHNIVQGSGGQIMDSEDHIGRRTASDGDGISIFGSSNIWIDHVTMSKCVDGLIDAIMGSTAITVSNSDFTDHDHVMLLGSSGKVEEDKKMQVTVAFNNFGEKLVQRMPRVRLGFAHVVNNDYHHWLKFPICGSHAPTIISQGNRYDAPDDKRIKEVTRRDFAEESVWKNWLWKSEEDLMLNDAFFVTSGNPKQKLPYSSNFLISPKPGSEVGRLTCFAGALDCAKGKPC